ncbi:MAG: hypothetical protein R2753_11965 [Chitinophagales bacterium]
MSESQNILEKLKKGDSYSSTLFIEKMKFVGWAAKQFNADDEMATEIYQDAVVTLYENIHSGKLTDMTLVLSPTYLPSEEINFLNSQGITKRILVFLIM